MEHVYMIECRHPEDARGSWQWVAVCETEDVAKNWWPEYISQSHKWYRLKGMPYCRTHYVGGEAVTYRISKHSFYSAVWYNQQKAKAS